jgi:hypothetical protein
MIGLLRGAALLVNTDAYILRPTTFNIILLSDILDNTDGTRARCATQFIRRSNTILQPILIFGAITPPYSSSPLEPLTLLTHLTNDHDTYTIGVRLLSSISCTSCYLSISGSLFLRLLYTAGVLSIPLQRRLLGLAAHLILESYFLSNSVAHPRRF